MLTLREKREIIFSIHLNYFKLFPRNSAPRAYKIWIRDNKANAMRHDCWFVTISRLTINQTLYIEDKNRMTTMNGSLIVDDRNIPPKRSISKAREQTKTIEDVDSVYLSTQSSHKYWSVVILTRKFIYFGEYYFGVTHDYVRPPKRMMILAI